MIFTPHADPDLSGDSSGDAQEMAADSFASGVEFTVAFDGRFAAILTSDAGWHLCTWGPIRPTHDANDGDIAPENEAV